jgi:hypothetical protein
MINKKWISAVIVLAPIMAHTDMNSLKEERMRILSELGLPLPDSGIQLVPRALLNLPKEVLEKGAREEEQMNKQGYVEEEIQYPKELMNIRAHAQLEFDYFAKGNSDTSTHIRRHAEDLKTGFTPKNLKKEFDYIGSAPEGGFHESGWSGVVQFFEVTNLGICAYGQMSVAVSHTAAMLALEGVTYTINNKPTTKLVKGSKQSGFLYTLTWYDDEYFHELECANNTYSKSLMDKTIELAKKIDRL